jgi:hypothetical protein
MSRIHRIVLTALFIGSVSMPALADQYSPISPRYPTAPNFYPSVDTSYQLPRSPPSERSRYPERYDGNGAIRENQHYAAPPMIVHQSVAVGDDTNIDQTVTIGPHEHYVQATPAAPVATPEPDKMVASAPMTVETNSYIASQTVKRHYLAPADEYFGQAAISILGVRNAIADIGRLGNGASVEKAHDLCRKLVLVEGSLRDWQAKYPDDTWLLPFGNAMLSDYAILYAALGRDDTSDARIHRDDLTAWLQALYPAKTAVN